MARTLAADNVAASLRGKLTFGFFVEIAWPSGTVYYHTGVGTYTWGSQNWIGVGDLGDVEAVEETIDTSSRDIKLTFSALSPGIVSDILDNDYWNQDVDIYLGFFDEDGALITDPDLIWSGFISTAEIVQGTNNAVSLTCWSRAALMDKANKRRYTQEDLQEYFGGDLFLEFLPEMQDLSLTWGGDKVRGKKDSAGSNIGARGTETQTRQP